MNEFERLRRSLSGEQRRQFDILTRLVDNVAANKGSESMAAPAPRGPSGNIPLPEGEDDLLELVKATEVEAICLAQVVPSDPAATSYVGGLPTASKKFAWPRSAGSAGYAPHSFIAQVDCATLPIFDGRQLLPSDGRLCFFVDWDILEGKKDRAKPYPGLVVFDRAGPAHELLAPSDLPHLFGVGAPYRFPWLKAVGDYPKTFSKWAMAAHPIRTYADESYVRPDGASEERYRNVRDKLLGDQMLALFGEPIKRPRRDRLRNELSPPTTLFPEYWLQLQVFFGGLANNLQDAIVRPLRSSVAWPADEVQLKHDYQALHKEVIGLLHEARERDAFSPVPAKIREGLMDWCRNLTQQIDPVPEAETFDRRSAYQLNEGFRIAHERTIADIVSRIGANDTLYEADAIDFVRYSRSTRHQMLGHPASVGSAGWRLGKGKMLLAEFASEASPWMWGDVKHLQYWIALSDLKSRRFDRIELAIG